VGCLHLHGEHSAEFDQSQSAADGAFCVVLAHVVSAEGRKQVIAGELQYLAVVSLDDGRGSDQSALHHAVYILRVQALTE
jgi:hypothetical protein